MDKFEHGREKAARRTDEFGDIEGRSSLSSGQINSIIKSILTLKRRHENIYLLSHKSELFKICRITPIPPRAEGLLTEVCQRRKHQN